jgi:hypothetical protein
MTTINSNSDDGEASELSSQEGIGKKHNNNQDDNTEEDDLTDDDEEEEDDDATDDEEDDDEDDDDSSVDSLNLDPYEESTLPEYSCRYCGIHDPASVAKCVESKKWFCNGSNYGGGGGGSHLVNHLVRSRSNQVQLHPNSPLGDTVLECYNCASKNAFVLGFVPASSGNGVVVLLCRVCVETVPALKDMDWELSQWHPLVQDRKFLPWLVKVPSDKQQLRARETTQAQLNKMEEMWKTDPDARYVDMDRPEVMLEEENVQTTLMQYEDGYHYQNVLAPLVKMEADYDKQIKESLSEESISIRWEKSLSGHNIATFGFHRIATESRIMVGDELRLKLGEGAQYLFGKPWEGVGYVKDISDGEVSRALCCVVRLATNRSFFLKRYDLSFPHEYNITTNRGTYPCYPTLPYCIMYPTAQTVTNYTNCRWNWNCVQLRHKYPIKSPKTSWWNIFGKPPRLIGCKMHSKHLPLMIHP